MAQRSYRVACHQSLKGVQFVNLLKIMLKTQRLLHLVNRYGAPGSREERFDTLQLALGKIKQGTHGTPLKITSPEPRSHLTINLSKIIIHPSCTIARKFFV